MASIAIASVLAFNLVCSGQQVTGNKSLGVVEKPYTDIYRIDLESQKWCDEGCRSPFDIHSVSETEIVLVDEYDIDPDLGETRSIHKIDRISGAHKIDIRSVMRPPIGLSHMISTRETTIKWTGTCQKSEFTGFPEPEQKF